MYPPRLLTTNDGNQPQKDEIGPEVLETIPVERNKMNSMYNMIHFDLDPQNSKKQVTQQHSAAGALVRTPADIIPFVSSPWRSR